MPAHDFTAPAIRRHFSRRDTVMHAVMRTHGPCSLLPKRTGTIYGALASAVFHQQLHGKAANTIRKRVEALVGGGHFPCPSEMLALPEPDLRKAGLSQNKMLALKDLAARTLDGTVPSGREIAKLSDDEIVERCIQVRGIGRWTVEMLLMFRLGRPDVLPVDDFGVRNGFRIAYKLPEMPKPKTLLEFGEVWRPWRSVAAWYMWRVADASKKTID